MLCYFCHVLRVYMYIQWLKEEFLGYLDKWEASVQAREGFDKTAKNKMLLSEATRSGLRFTGEIKLAIFQVPFRHVPPAPISGLECMCSEIVY